jgi:hypothetical protein
MKTKAHKTTSSIPTAGPARDRRAAHPGKRREYAWSPGDGFHSADEIEFMTAIDRYKRERDRRFPSSSEVLEILRSLGYRKIAEPSALPKK